MFEGWFEAGWFSPPARGRGEGQLLDRDPPAERHRRAAHGARAERLDPGRADPPPADARRPTRWILGTDHAGIGTQAMVEKELEAQGTSRLDLGRDEFVRRVWEWRDQYGSQIIGQFKRLGASADYSNERFTMDDAYAARRHQGLRRAARPRPHLPRQLHGQLGPGAALGDLRPRGRADGRSPTLSTRSTTRLRTARARSRSPRSGRRRCWRTPRSPSIPRTSATAT